MENPITFLAFTKHLFFWEFLGVVHAKKLHFSPSFLHISNIPDGQGIHNLVANSLFMLLKDRASKSWASSLAAYKFLPLVWIVTEAGP